MNIKHIKDKYLINTKFLVFFLLFLSTAATLHKFFTHKLANYLTFSSSFWNMFHGVNPYYQILEYKYSPAFCVLMSPMAILPDWLGAIIWNAVNTLVLYVGINRLKLDNTKKAFILWFILFEFLTSIQNFQSNILISGLILLAFSFFEERRTFWTSFIITLLFFIKIFGAGIGIIFLFYPKKIKFIICSLFWTLILIFIPLVFVNWDFFIILYRSWWIIMTTDFSASMGVSIMALINMIISLSKSYIQIFGLFLLVLPLLVNFKYFSEYKNRLMLVASIMLWMIIFNHKAESPTFIIAVTGSAIWYVLSKKTVFNLVLMLLVFIFTTLSPTDHFPKIKFKFAHYNVVKALPCVLVWIKIQVDLYSIKNIQK